MNRLRSWKGQVRFGPKAFYSRATFRQFLVTTLAAVLTQLSAARSHILS